ncbi:MAG: TerB family tellurite resistance protein, partial [Candidatus Methanomethylophilaceae archaeon]|nr:TerB family tellurite resistance protein [Candidatus Methanomethylophilaceae archaeon]
MSQFDKLCEVLETMDPDTFNQLINEKSANIIQALSTIMEDGFDVITVYVDFLLCAAAADGRLAEEEYILL